MSPDVIKQFVEVQKLKIQNETKELFIREKEIASNEKLALKSMELEAELLKNRPHDMRKNITRLAYIFCAILLIILLFICWLIHSQNKDFAVQFLDKASYVVTAAISFYFGRKSKSQKKDKETSNNSVEQID